MAIKPIPDGYHTIQPYLLVADVRAQIEFLKQAFGGETKECFDREGGPIMHAEVKIGDSIVMLGTAQGERKQTRSMIYLYVEDTDAAYQRALKAGATSVMEPADQFYGDRNGAVKDASGNEWWIATHVEDVSPEEMEKRAKAQSH